MQKTKLMAGGGDHQARNGAHPATPKQMGSQRSGGDLRQFKDEYEACVNQILNAVKINSLLVSSAIQVACVDFKSFTDDKIKKLKGQEEIDTVAKAKAEPNSSSGFQNSSTR
jgi:hypothetical protein